MTQTGRRWPQQRIITVWHKVICCRGATEFCLSNRWSGDTVFLYTPYPSFIGSYIVHGKKSKCPGVRLRPSCPDVLRTGCTIRQSNIDYLIVSPWWGTVGAEMEVCSAERCRRYPSFKPAVDQNLSLSLFLLLSVSLCLSSLFLSWSLCLCLFLSSLFCCLDNRKISLILLIWKDLK